MQVALSRGVEEGHAKGGDIAATSPRDVAARGQRTPNAAGTASGSSAPDELQNMLIDERDML